MQLKNTINYFYNIIADNIHQTKKYYYFDYYNNHYILISYSGDPNLLSTIYNLHLTLLRQGIYVHQIILNNNKNIATIINGTPYILLKTQYYIGKINFDTILAWSNISLNNNYSNHNNWILHNSNTHFIITKNNLQNSKLERNNIGNLWATKNDYLEYQISQLGNKYNLLKNSFSYYIGLGETAISLINTITNNQPKTICHKRIKKDDTIFDFYNPLNIIIDVKTRDIAEYIKTDFFSNTSKININKNLNKFLHNNQLTPKEHITFLARMLYPTYYFDLFEEIISGKESEEKIKKITTLSSEYEILLRNLYKYYRKTINIEPIEWLE